MDAFVELKTGERVLVDPDDFERLSKFKWHLNTGRYAIGWVQVDGTRRKMLMHRFILQAAVGEKIDHRNGNGLDNRRANLRLATHTENMQNTKIHEGRRYKGVHYYKSRDRYQAYIQKDGQRISLGYWDTAEQAAHAYDQAAVCLFGEFARTNFPVEPAIPATMPNIPKRRRGSKPKTFRSETHKECSICHQVMSRTEFGPGRKGPGADPNDTRCLSCNRERWIQMSPDKEGQNARRRERRRLQTKAPRAPRAPRTHCPSGHPYDAENTWHCRGRRYCRACRRERKHG